MIIYAMQNLLSMYANLLIVQWPQFVAILLTVPAESLSFGVLFLRIFVT